MKARAGADLVCDNHRWRFIVNLRKNLYLTDFLKCKFPGGNARNLHFSGGKKINATAVYHISLYYTYRSPGANGSVLPGGTVSSAIASTIATVT
jgi:hypothetical protein